MPQLAELKALHLVWRHGALVPVGLASAPCNPQSRTIWVFNAARTWLRGTAEGRRLLTRMQGIPSAVDVAAGPTEAGRSSRFDTTTAATTAAPPSTATTPQPPPASTTTDPAPAAP